MAKGRKRARKHAQQNLPKEVSQEQSSPQRTLEQQRTAEQPQQSQRQRAAAAPQAASRQEVDKVPYWQMKMKTRPKVDKWRGISNKSVQRFITFLGGLRWDMIALLTLAIWSLVAATNHKLSHLKNFSLKGIVFGTMMGGYLAGQILTAITCPLSSFYEKLLSIFALGIVRLMQHYLFEYCPFMVEFSLKDFCVMQRAFDMALITSPLITFFRITYDFPGHRTVEINGQAVLIKSVILPLLVRCLLECHVPGLD